jgi:hypothetical protein
MVATSNEISQLLEEQDVSENFWMKNFIIHTTQQNTVRMMKWAEYVATTQEKQEIHIQPAFVFTFLL